MSNRNHRGEISIKVKINQVPHGNLASTPTKMGLAFVLKEVQPLHQAENPKHLSCTWLYKGITSLRKCQALIAFLFNIKTLPSQIKPYLTLNLKNVTESLIVRMQAQTKGTPILSHNLPNQI
jgi:hypothetical protein